MHQRLGWVDHYLFTHRQAIAYFLPQPSPLPDLYPPGHRTPDSTANTCHSPSSRIWGGFETLVSA